MRGRVFVEGAGSVRKMCVKICFFVKICNDMNIYDISLDKNTKRNVLFFYNTQTPHVPFLKLQTSYNSFDVHIPELTSS